MKGLSECAIETSIDIVKLLKKTYPTKKKIVEN
jgi:hypothetical protein